MKEEQSDQNRDSDRDDIGVEQGRGDMQSLNRTQDRDRRSDHPICVKQSRSEQAEQEKEFSPPDDFTNQCRQGKDAALAPIIRPQNEDEIFDRNNQEERPKDEGEDAEHIGLMWVAPHARRKSIRARHRADSCRCRHKQSRGWPRQSMANRRLCTGDSPGEGVCEAASGIAGTKVAGMEIPSERNLI